MIVCIIKVAISFQKMAATSCFDHMAAPSFKRSRKRLPVVWLKPLLLCAALFTALDRGVVLADENPPPTFKDISYGPDARNLLDFWQAPAEGPRPLLVYIHGGGWLHGEKTDEVPELKPFLDRGISCASITYRFTNKDPLPAPVRDAARAVQFLRSKADEWKIDKSRIALIGGSAGACSAMWIVLHDDLADPKSSDPVLRESTRVSGAAVSNGQTTIDLKVFKEWFGDSGVHPMLYKAVGEPSVDDALKNYDHHKAVYQEFSPYNHVDAHDPPLYLSYSDSSMAIPSKNAIHHPLFGIKLREKSKQVGHTCYLQIQSVEECPDFTDATDFLISILTRKS